MGGSNGRQRCIVDGSVSDWLPVTFTYLDNIAADLSSKVALFADDCVLFRPIYSCEDQYLLQQDLDRLVSWKWKWQMNFRQV